MNTMPRVDGSNRLLLVQLYVPYADAILPRESPPSLFGLAKLTSVAEGLGVGVDVLDMRAGLSVRSELAVFCDADRMAAHWKQPDPEIDGAASAVLDALGFSAAAWVGLSLSLACMVPRHAVAGRTPYLHLAAALAGQIRKRTPSAITTVGGLRAFGSAEDRTWLANLFRDAPIDHVVLYGGERAIERILRGEGPEEGERRGNAWWWTNEASGDIGARTLPTYHRSSVSAGALRPSEVVRHYRMHSDWGDEVRGEDDVPSALLQFAFVHGCPGRCAFCAQAGTELRKVRVGEVVDALIDVRDRLGCSDFTFVNSQINASKSYANDFCDELIARRANIRWSDSVNCRALDEALLDKMRQAGAIRLVFGVETPDARMLRYVRKGTTLDRIERMLRYSDSVGIWNHVLLIGGMPYETDDSVASICTFVEGLGDALNHATVSAFYLPEGSPFQTSPESFGIELLGREDGCYKFREVRGLSWEEKRMQIQRSTDSIRASIAKVTRTARASRDMLDLDLLHLLYRRYGHERKRDIQRVYRMTFADDLRTVFAEDYTLQEKLRAFGVSFRIDGAEASDTVEATLCRGALVLPTMLRVGVLGDEPPRYRGSHAAYSLRGARPVDARIMRLVDAVGRALVSRADGFFRARDARLPERGSRDS